MERANPAAGENGHGKAGGLGRRTALLAAGQALSKGGQLAGALILVRVLAPDEWARMALLVTVYAAATSLGTLNLHQGLVYFAARTPRAERRQLAVSSSAMLAASGAAAAAIVLAAAPFLGESGFDLGAELAWVALAILFEIPAAGAAQLLLADERPGLAALWDVGQAAMLLAALVAPPLAGLGVRGAALALVGQAALRLAAYATLVARLPGRWRGLGLAHARAQLRYGLPLGAALAASALSRQVDKWLVAALDPDQFGVYAVAAQEVPLLPVLPFAIGAALATRMVRSFQLGRIERAADYWLAQTTRMSVVVVPAAVGVILAGREIMVLLFTPAYADAALPFQLYSAILLHRVAEYGLILRAAGATRALLSSAALLLLLNAGLGAILTALVGAPGAAAAALCAHLGSWVWALRCIALALELPFRAVFPWRLYGQVVAVSATAGAIAWTAARAVPSSPLARLVLELAIYGALLALGFRATRLTTRVSAVPPDDV